MKNLIVLSTLATALLCSGRLHATPVPCSSIPGNLVTNCGFETGTLSGWTATPAGFSGQYYGVDSSDANSGNYGAYLAGQTANVFLTQTLSTVAGSAYYVTFELAHPDANIVPYRNSFLAMFGSTTLLSETNQQFGYTLYTFGATATSSSTVLSFGAFDPLNFFSLDDVAVYPAPEPSTIVLSLPALIIGLSLWRRRRTATAQVIQ